jgi:hypothetical protein
MNTEEQNIIKTIYHKEALCYMSNATETLNKAEKEDRFYSDDKYVKIACKIAYNAIVKALDGYLLLNDVKPQKGRKSIEYYRNNVSKIDHNLMNYLNNTYEILLISGYYEGVTSVKTITDGFELANIIIGKIKP